MWTNKQHIMSRMARDYRVIFVNFGGFKLGSWLKALHEQRGSLGLFDPRIFAEPARSHVDGVEVLDVFGSLGPLWQLDDNNPVRVALQFDWRRRVVGRWLERQGITDAILWVYHPGFGGQIADIPHSLVVYDCVDEYVEFPAYRKNSHWLRAREEELCRRADLVFATSKGLYEKKRHLNPAHTHLVHNVGDAEHFGRARLDETVLPPDMARIPEPRVVFVGAVSDYKLNSDFVKAAALRHPEWQLVLIGPVGLSDRGGSTRELSEIPNVHLMGHRSYAELPAYLKGANVTVIPYRINSYTDHVFPIKFFEMLATGRPLVISPLPAVEDYYDLVRVAHTEDEFVEHCGEALARPSEGLSARLAAAEANSWGARVARLAELVEDRLRATERADSLTPSSAS